jgi:hypothetical protein
MAGHLWIGLGDKGLHASSDSGETFARVPGVDEVRALGFGKAAPGVDHPTAYIEGRVAGGAAGVFRSTDLGASWVRIGDRPAGYHLEPRVLVGDMNRYGRVVLGTAGSGFIFGQPVPRQGGPGRRDRFGSGWKPASPPADDRAAPPAGMRRH